MATSYYNTSAPDDVFPVQSLPQDFQKCLAKKKRSKNPENWLKTKRKKAILAGQSYVNTRGAVIAPKTVGPDCSCRNKCFLGVEEESRELIFNGFYNLNSYDEQNAYLYGLIRRHDIIRKRQPNSDKRTCNYKYYVRVKGREVQVCKKAFASIHGISDKKIRTLCLKHERNIMFPHDNRGRHTNRPKRVSPELVALVKQHIVQVLSGSSASDFLKTDKNQAVQDINVTKLHKNFLRQHEPRAIDPVTDKIDKQYDAKVKTWVYFKIFHEEFESLDFNSVKRKLSDVRRTLEVTKVLQNNKRKGGKSTKIKCKTKAENSQQSSIFNNNNDDSIVTMFNSDVNFSPVAAPKANVITGTSLDSSCSRGSVSVPTDALGSSNFTGQLSSEHGSVAQPLTQSCLYNSSLQQHPLNLQVSSASSVCSILSSSEDTLHHQQQEHTAPQVIVHNQQQLHQHHAHQMTGHAQSQHSHRLIGSNHQLLHHSTSNSKLNSQFGTSSGQALPISIPTNGQPYCLSLSNIPNIITVPPSSCATIINVSANKLSSPTNALITATLVGPGSSGHGRPLELTHPGTISVAPSSVALCLSSPHSALSGGSSSGSGGGGSVLPPMAAYHALTVGGAVTHITGVSGGEGAVNQTQVYAQIPTVLTNTAQSAPGSMLQTSGYSSPQGLHQQQQHHYIFQ